MKNFWDKLVASGLWLQPCIMLGVLKYLEKTKPQMLAEKGSWLTLFVISFLPVVVMWRETSKNPNEDNAMMGKEKAMYPAVDKKLLHNNPTGIVLGKDKFSKKYVCKELEEDGHVFLIGGSGSGKSSCFVIPTLLVNPKTRIFAIDIKGELSFKTAKYGDEQVLIFNPSNRSQYGYDPFYALGRDSTTQQILETMQTITYSLIALPAGLKDPFWKVSARNLLIGLLVYYYKQGIHNLVGIIDEILGKSVRDSIEQIMNTTKPESVEYRYIVQFEAMEDETLGGIIAEMNNHLVVFANDQDIRYAFRDNGCKVNPLKLEEGYSIYIVVKEEKLSAYYDVLQLIINQTLSQLEKRAEDIEDCFSFYGSSDKKDNALLYEVEYLISGKNSDIDNLKRVANYILLLRFINNYIFTGKDTQMKMQINTMASAITGVMGMPQTMKAVQVLIRMAISYGESLLELHTLFSGGEVPLIKDKTTWNLTLKTMGEQLRNKQIVKKGKKNISYKDYLKLFLLTKGNSRTVCYRMMDIMQENIASKEPGFLMENCLFSYSWKGSLAAGGVKLNFVKQCSY